WRDRGNVRQHHVANVAAGVYAEQMSVEHHPDQFRPIQHRQRPGVVTSHQHDRRPGWMSGIRPYRTAANDLTDGLHDLLLPRSTLITMPHAQTAPSQATATSRLSTAPQRADRDELVGGNHNGSIRGVILYAWRSPPAARSRPGRRYSLASLGIAI